MASSKEPPPAGIGAGLIGGSPVAAEKDNFRRKPTQQLLAPGAPHGKARFRADGTLLGFRPGFNPGFTNFPPVTSVTLSVIL
jgi:hypothetical protein